MKRIKKASKIIFALLIIGGWIFYGFPMITVVHAANTGAKTAGGNAAVTASAGDNNGFETTPTNTTTDNAAYAVSANSGTAASSACSLPNTSSDQHNFTTFGITTIPSTAKVIGIAVTTNAKYDSATGVNTLCVFLSYDGGTNWTAGQNTPDISTADVTNTLGSATNLWGRASWSTTELNNTNFKVRVMTLVANTARDASLDYLAVTVYYNEAPNVPTQNSPLNAATGVSVTPTFLMTATDPDADKLGYKVTIYSNSICTTVVQTNDQAVSSTGWTGSNATCTAAPTACYTSGTQGSFLTQTALTASTQYWWKASAKDPDGNGAFTDSSTCNTFTTVAAASLTFVVSTNNFPTLTPGSPVFATSTLSVDTNNSTGWNVTASRDDLDTTFDLDTDATVNITDQTAWVPGAATTTAGNAVRVSSLDSSQKVLAFRTMTASGTVSFISTSWWGATDAYIDSATTLWAGFPSTAQKIGDSSVSSGGSAKLNTVLYYLDVPSTQKTGGYSGGITYTATMNP